MLKGSIVTHVCPICKKGFHVKPSHLKTRKCCSRLCSGKFQSRDKIGPLSPSWKGGMYTDKYGYVRVFRPDHPHGKTSGYVKRARLVMEATLGRYLTSQEFVHHINKVKDDDRPENLRVMTNSQHAVLHQNNISDELREIRRIRATGRIKAPETIEKHRKAMLGKKKSPEHVANMRRSRWGR